MQSMCANMLERRTQQINTQILSIHNIWGHKLMSIWEYKYTNRHTTTQSCHFPTLAKPLSTFLLTSKGFFLLSSLARTKLRTASTHAVDTNGAYRQIPLAMVDFRCGLKCKQQFISIEDKWTAEAQRTREAGEDLNPEVITANPTKEEEEMREIWGLRS